MNRFDPYTFTWLSGVRKYRLDSFHSHVCQRPVERVAARHKTQFLETVISGDGLQAGFGRTNPLELDCGLKLNYETAGEVVASFDHRARRRFIQLVEGRIGMFRDPVGGIIPAGSVTVWLRSSRGAAELACGGIKQQRIRKQNRAREQTL
jgi:hypothetical protein